jgi:hypothetical protein
VPESAHKTPPILRLIQQGMASIIRIACNPITILENGTQESRTDKIWGLTTTVLRPSRESKISLEWEEHETIIRK